MKALKVSFGHPIEQVADSNIVYTFEVLVNGTSVGTFDASSNDKRPSGLKAKLSEITAISELLVANNTLEVTL